ncbi:MAG: hypothetical protein IJ060_13370 [Oscillospiraceae bacterium]|nr:hypothetical protein [Oscillospiraceae bacterium]MBQ8923121.1 hypothetical protein [Oscillospiraceae bacterium]
MSIKRKLTALTASLLLFSCQSLTAFAEVALPEGAVKGLPEKLTAMDSDGNVVSSDTGEYFFRVEDMDYGVTYTKDVQIMNLRDDKSYHIYFYVEPLWKNGEIDLEKGCDCTFWLDGQAVFRGKVTGEPYEGYLDLSQEVLDCGNYDPGESHTLRCAVVWNDLDVLVGVDNGHRLVDIDGEHVLVGTQDSGYVEGQIEFKWIFYAAVNDDYTPPKTGLLGTNNAFWMACIAAAGILTGGMILLVLFKKKEKQKE